MAAAIAAAACSGGALPPILGGPAPSSSARGRMTPRNGLEVIGAMRRAHPSRALKSLSYTVTITGLDDDSTHREARAHASLPGRFRESVVPSGRRTGFVRDRQRLALFEQGRRVTLVRRMDLGALLAYDVFAQGIDTTIMWLDSARVRYGLTREDELDGRRVWVVGAAEGDTVSPQFWVDADEWRVLRVIQRDPQTPSRTLDLRFVEFSEQLDVPVPVRVDVYRGGKPFERRVVSDLVVNPKLSSRAFDLSQWRDLR